MTAPASASGHGTVVGRVVGLWRYPVKSMGGEALERLDLHPRGVRGDRLWAVRDLESDQTATARRVPRLLKCSARYAVPPTSDPGSGEVWPVRITLPDGTEVGSDDPGVHDALSDLAGRRLRLVPLPGVDERRAHRGGLRTQAAIRRDLGMDRDDPLPDGGFLPASTIVRLARYSTPPGTFVDVAGLHVLSTASLAVLGAAGVDDDVRRFRPNVLVEVSDARPGCFPERAWVGQDLALGSTATASVTMPTIRCVVPSREQPGLVKDPAVTRAVAQVAQRFLGVYAEPGDLGAVCLGDVVRPLGATPRGALGAARAPGAATGQRPARAPGCATAASWAFLGNAHGLVGQG